MRHTIIPTLFTLTALCAPAIAQVSQQIDPCKCENVEFQAPDKKTVVTTTQISDSGQRQLIFIASMRYTIEREDGACQTLHCTSPKECVSTINASVTVHSDAHLLALTGSNALMVDGNPVSQASGPTPVSDSKSAECGGTMRPEVEANNAVDGSAVLWVRAFDWCKSCLGISSPGGTGGGGDVGGGDGGGN